MPDKHSFFGKSVFPFIPILYSVVAAFSLAGLAILIRWGFELRSLVKLLLQASPFALPLSGLFYFFIFRRVARPFPVDFSIIAIGVCASALAASRLVPPQLTAARSVTAFLLTALLFMILYLLLVSPLFKIEKIPWNRVLLWAALLGGLAGMALIFRDALYARMYSDDFCYAVTFDELGFPGAGLWFYRNWSGRFTSNFLVMAFADMPPAVAFQLILTVLSLSLIHI